MTRREALAELDILVRFGVIDNDPDSECSLGDMAGAIEKVAKSVLAIERDRELNEQFVAGSAYMRECWKGCEIAGIKAPEFLPELVATISQMIENPGMIEMKHALPGEQVAMNYHRIKVAGLLDVARKERS